MKRQRLLHKNILYFTRYYRLIAIAVVITVSVIVGSLAVGDSVRMTLVKRVTERLGDTETILFSRNGFMSDSLLYTPLFNESVRGILLTDGFIARNGKLISVWVWGVDSLSIPSGSARLNTALAKELGLGVAEDIVLRLPATGLVPSGSLFVTDNYTTSLRLAYDGTIPVEEGGNICLKNEQILPLNLFVDRKMLAEALDVKNKINLILTNQKISSSDLAKIDLSALTSRSQTNYTEITTDRVFLQKEVVETICRNNPSTNRLFSYLSNAIEKGDASIPYSFITAMDRYGDRPLRKDEILLSDYAARRLQAQVGDSIHLGYYISKGLKTLDTKEITLCVGQIIPLAEWVKDGALSADFPGLSDVERCTDWHSDLPINMDLITDEDERYWNLYRTTPKAIIPYNAVVEDWGNAYGTATALRIDGTDPDLTELRPDHFGIQLIHPREAGLYAASNGVDFAGLFLALGIFILVSALLLMQNPVSEMFYQRRREMALLEALGYTRQRIARLLWAESIPVVGIASGVGVVVGLLYTGLILWLLGNVWKGATQTDGFGLYPDIRSLAIGILVSIGLSFGLLYRAILRALKKKDSTFRPDLDSLRRKGMYALLLSLLTVGIVGLNFMVWHSVVLFMISGGLWIVMMALWGAYMITRKKLADPDRIDRKRLVWDTLYAHKKRATLSFFALAIGVFIVFSVGLNRQDFSGSSQVRTGTGGYTLWCQSNVPVYYDLTTRKGKEKLTLTDLPATTEIVQCLRYQADDASCLNLNKVTSPTVLGIDMQTLSESDLQIEQSIYKEGREHVFKQIRHKEGTVYPALVDATVLTWSIGLNLGDTLYYKGDGGQEVAIRLAATLSNSIFQGNILIDRSLFREIWDETGGSEVFLLKTQESEKEEVKTLVSQALNEYGVQVMSTVDRLKQFNTVTDTYLTIFMTLGGFGLLLGILSFIIVIRKNLVMRAQEIRLYRTLGFPDRTIRQMLYKENVLVPLYAIGTGVTAAFVSVSMQWMHVGKSVGMLAVALAGLLTGCVILFVKRLVRLEIERTDVTDKKTNR